MRFQTAVDASTSEKAFRTVVNANTITGTITAGSIAIGSPLVLSTSTASLEANYVNRPATSTSKVNNLFIGNLHDAPGSKIYLDREEVGIAQVYGPDLDAIVQILTTTSVVGCICVPEQFQFLIPVDGPVTAAATATAAHGEVPALGGLAVLMEQIASSSATSTTTARVFLRCL